MTVRGRAVHNNHNPTMYIYWVIFTYPFIFSYLMPVWVKSWKVQKGLKWNLVY